MKKKICLLFVLVFVFASVAQFSVLASDIMPLNNNTNLTKTRFSISDTGEAVVSLNFEGYPNVTTGATISIKIEKRNFLLFWADVVEETITVNNYYYENAFYYQLEDTGTYRCTVEYVISGTGGADDVITFEDTKTYG
jgi:hypothetical protein